MFSANARPSGNRWLTCLVALIPVVSLLVMLAVFRTPAWLATLIGSIDHLRAGGLGMADAAGDGLATPTSTAPPPASGTSTGSPSGAWCCSTRSAYAAMFENFRRWLIAQGTRTCACRRMLFAWAFGALLEGLVGFGYPWAVVAPILISLGIPDLDAIRVAAIANNAPVSYGALGAPIIALAAVTGYPLLALSASVGTRRRGAGAAAAVGAVLPGVGPTRG